MNSSGIRTFHAVEGDDGYLPIPSRNWNCRSTQRIHSTSNHNLDTRHVSSKAPIGRSKTSIGESLSKSERRSRQPDFGVSMYSTRQIDSEAGIDSKTLSERDWELANVEYPHWIPLPRQQAQVALEGNIPQGHRKTNSLPAYNTLKGVSLRLKSKMSSSICLWHQLPHAPSYLHGEWTFLFSGSVPKWQLFHSFTRKYKVAKV